MSFGIQISDAAKQILAFIKSKYSKKRNVIELASINPNFDKVEPINLDKFRERLSSLSKPIKVIENLEYASNQFIRSFDKSMHRKQPSNDKEFTLQEIFVQVMNNRLERFHELCFDNVALINPDANEVVLDEIPDDKLDCFKGYSDSQIETFARLGSLSQNVANISFAWLDALISYANAEQYTDDAKAILSK